MCVSGSRGFGVGVHSHSTVTPHGLLPLLSFYSLLLGDTALPQNATQAKHLSVPPPDPALRGYCDSSPLFQHTFSDPSPLCGNWQHSWFWTYVETWEILQHSFFFVFVWGEGIHLWQRRACFIYFSVDMYSHISSCARLRHAFFSPQDIVQQLWFYVYAYI